MKKHFALCTMVCLVLFGTFLKAQHANTQPVTERPTTYTTSPQWQEFSSRAGGFSVLMPGLPKEETNSKDFPVVGKGDFHLFTVQSDLGAFVAAYVEVPGLAKQSQSFCDSFGKGFLANVGEGTARGAGGKVVNEKDISYGTNPGKEFLIDVPSGQATVRAYFINRRGYELIAAPGASGTPETVKKFLDSFRITPR